MSDTASSHLVQQRSDTGVTAHAPEVVGGHPRSRYRSRVRGLVLIGLDQRCQGTGRAPASLWHIDTRCATDAGPGRSPDDGRLTGDEEADQSRKNTARKHGSDGHDQVLATATSDDRPGFAVAGGERCGAAGVQQDATSRRNTRKKKKRARHQQQAKSSASCRIWGSTWFPPPPPSRPPLCASCGKPWPAEAANDFARRPGGGRPVPQAEPRRRGSAPSRTSWHRLTLPCDQHPEPTGVPRPLSARVPVPGPARPRDRSSLPRRTRR